MTEGTTIETATTTATTMAETTSAGPMNQITITIPKNQTTTDEELFSTTDSYFTDQPSTLPLRNENIILDCITKIKVNIINVLCGDLNFLCEMYL